jgi:hypothetical protein
VAVHILEGSHGRLMGEDLAVKEVADEVERDEFDVLVPKQKNNIE